MTSAGQYLEPWKSTAASLFNPYLNINQLPHGARQESVRTRALTPTRHFRAPPESLVETTSLKVTTSESVKRPKSKRFPNQNAAEEVSMYVQQMIHSQFCGRSGTPGDLRYDDDRLRHATSTPSSRSTIRKRISSSKKQSRVSQYPLDDFFNTADEQMSRMASMMPGRESSFSEGYSLCGESPRQKSNNGERLTLADMCHLASDVGDKMSQSKEKVGLEAIRGFRLPSARLTYEPYEYHPIEVPALLGQHPTTDHIRLNDILTDDNFSRAPMIEVVGDDVFDDKTSRASRSHVKSSATTSTSKVNEFRDWRGRISQADLPDVRNRLRRQYSASAISPQRPCTAASNLSKSRPESSGLHINDFHRDLENSSTAAEKMIVLPVPSVLKNPSSMKQRQRTYPLNVRIDETNVKQGLDQRTETNETGPAQSYTSTENTVDPPCLSLPSDNNDELAKIGEIIPHSTPVPISSSATPFTMYTNGSSHGEILSPELASNRRPYKLVPSASKQVYRMTEVPSKVTGPSHPNEQLTQLTLSQLELLENYDPMISAKIGIPFIPVQMLIRPREANQSAKCSIDQMHRKYPKKNGQPVFEPRAMRSSHSLIDIAQTLQLTKSKRIRVDRQTTFERPANEPPVEDTIQIKQLDNPNRLAISAYAPSEQRISAKHTNSIRTSSKAHPSQLDDLSVLVNSTSRQPMMPDELKGEKGMERNFSVLNIRTQQEVDQVRQRTGIQNRRLVFPTTIITNTAAPLLHQRQPKLQGRPIPSVFLTQDPDEYNYSISIYRQARHDVDVKRAFRGFIAENTQKKLSADERRRREEQRRAAITIQRAYREHLRRREQIESRRPSSSKRRDEERQHRRILSAKRAQNVEEQLVEQAKIREENREYKKMIDDTGPSIRIFASFKQVDAQFSKSTLHRAATCIQRWWRGFIVRHRWKCLRNDVAAFGLTWSEFASRYRQVVQRVQRLRQSDYRQFVFNIDQARDFLTTEKKLTTIFNAVSINNKLEAHEVEKFFENCDLSATPYEVEEALDSVLTCYPTKKNESLAREVIFDVVYYVFPPKAVGLGTSRKSTWIRPIIDGEDETAIRGTSLLEPIDMALVYKFLGKD